MKLRKHRNSNGRSIAPLHKTHPLLPVLPISPFLNTCSSSSVSVSPITSIPRLATGAAAKTSNITAMGVNATGGGDAKNQSNRVIGCRLVISPLRPVSATATRGHSTKYSTSGQNFKPDPYKHAGLGQLPQKVQGLVMSYKLRARSKRISRGPPAGAMKMPRLSLPPRSSPSHCTRRLGPHTGSRSRCRRGRKSRCKCTGNSRRRRKNSRRCCFLTCSNRSR